MRATRILVVDDYEPWRSMLRTQLAAHPGFQVIDEAVNGVEAIKKAEQLHPDVVLLDVGMPLMNGLEAAPKILRVSPGSKIIFLSQQHHNDIRTAALATGAAGYLLKSDAARELAFAIHAAPGGTQPLQCMPVPLNSAQ